MCVEAATDGRAYFAVKDGNAKSRTDSEKLSIYLYDDLGRNYSALCYGPNNYCPGGQRTEMKWEITVPPCTSETASDIIRLASEPLRTEGMGSESSSVDVESGSHFSGSSSSSAAANLLQGSDMIQTVSTLTVSFV